MYQLDKQIFCYLTMVYLLIYETNIILIYRFANNTSQYKIISNNYTLFTNKAFFHGLYNI